MQISMKISGFSFIRNALKYDYPIKECIDTLLGLCDEVVIVVAESEDETLSFIKSLEREHLKIIDSKWNPNLGYNLLSELTNLAMSNCAGEWGIYLQSDEIIHEKYYSAILEAIKESNEDKEIEGLLFNYKHFYGSHRLYHLGRRFYRDEVRAIRLGAGIVSYGDAKGFRKDGRKLIVRRVNAEIYHYGWARDPKKMESKTRNFHQLWHSKESLKKIMEKEAGLYELEKNFHLISFEEDHPMIMHGWLKKNEDWSYRNYEIWDNSLCELNLFDYFKKAAAFIERKTWRIGYNKPYKYIVH